MNLINGLVRAVRLFFAIPLIVAGGIMMILAACAAAIIGGVGFGILLLGLLVGPDA